MSMEAQEEAMAATHSSGSANNNDFSHHSIVKGKRTKRPRLLQAPAPASSASSSGDHYLSGSTTTEEEEDMANCLILLARGRAWDAGKRSLEPRLEEDAPAAANGGDQKLSSRNTYECKTCSKCFPSFQALGGHRASHKRPKMSLGPVATEEKKPMEEDILQTSISSYPKITTTNSNRDINTTTTPTFYNNNNAAHHDKPRVHECSVCGSEFSSGQALGGHMRRHRPAMTVPEPREAKKEKSILSLDLNLPAPSDDERGDFPTSPSFALAVGKPPSTVFSASALVDCHY